MRFLDKVALNRLIAIVLSFILRVIKIFGPKEIEKVDPKPWKPRWRRR